MLFSHGFLVPVCTMKETETTKYYERVRLDYRRINLKRLEISGRFRKAQNKQNKQIDSEFKIFCKVKKLSREKYIE